MTHPDPARYASYTTAAVDAAVHNIMDARKPADGHGGARNDTLNVEAFNLGQLVGAGILDEEHAIRSLETAALQAGLEPGETMRTIASGLINGMAKPRDLSKIKIGQNGHGQIDDPATVLVTPGPGLVPYYGLVDWAALWANETPEIDWLCEPIVAAGQAVSLYSPAKTGKSLLLLEIAAALATGQPVLGNPALPPVVVAYIDHEGTEDDLRDRLEELGYSDQDNLSNLHYYLLGEWPPLDTDAGGIAFLTEMQRINARLSILDTISRAFVGEEDSADTFLALYRFTVRRLKLARIAFLRLDHSGKDVSRGMRGTSAKVSDVDVVWKLMISGIDRLCLTRELSRQGYGPSEMFLRRELGPLRHTRETGDIGHEHEVERVIILLEKYGIPVETGRPTAAKTLRDNGIKVRNSILAEAVARRRLRLSVSEFHPNVGSSDHEPTPQDSGPGQLGTAWGQPGDRLGTVPGLADDPRALPVPVPPPLGGDRGQPGVGVPNEDQQEPWPKCVVCGFPLDETVISEGFDRHPSCERSGDPEQVDP